nr:PREDICTED: cholesterol 7-desaturase-like isoform X2 [Bemisia tabaci]
MMYGPSDINDTLLIQEFYAKWDTMAEKSWTGAGLKFIVMNVIYLIQQISLWFLVPTIIFAYLCYYFIIRPKNYVRDLSEVGYDYFIEQAATRHQKKSIQQLVKNIRKTSKIGNIPPVYPNGWFNILESSEVSKNQVKYVTALGENFAVFRTPEGKVHIMDAYCPHLGANMGLGGVVRGDCLECPFHGWQFDGNSGKCTSVPYSEKVPDFARVRTWKSCEVNDLIFVWYHAEGEDPTWEPQPVKQISNGDWWFIGRSEHMINAHIQEVPENGADLAHLNVIHSPLMLGGSDLRYYEKLWTAFARHHWAGTWHANTDAPHTATMHLSHEVRLFNKVRVITVKVTAEQIGPGYVELTMDTCLGRLVMLQTVTPVEPLVQKVIHRVYCPPTLLLYGHFVLSAECIMLERDIMVWNHKKYEEKPILVKEDKSILHYRRWYSQFYSKNSPRFKYQKDTLDW